MEGKCEGKLRRFWKGSPINVLLWGLAFTDIDPWGNKNTLPTRHVPSRLVQLRFRSVIGAPCNAAILPGTNEGLDNLDDGVCVALGPRPV